ncbi:MAG: transaldolase [Gemmatimonadota bacterium]
MVAQAFRIAIFADGADIAQMIAAHRSGSVDGFTTNPTLMLKDRAPNYTEFSRAVLREITDVPVCFEVFADDLEEIGAQARVISSWAPNVFVKIPVCTTDGISTAAVIEQLGREGVKLNVTAVMSLNQVRQVLPSLPTQLPAILSIFAGRIADTGRDPVPIMHEAVQLCASRPNVRVLWASPREVLNVYQAESCGCHIIAVTSDLRQKLALRGKDLDEFSRATVKMFYDDAQRAGYQLEQPIVAV